jgi:hypothetical protein
MSKHAYALVPIESWCYSSPDVAYRGSSVDIGLMAESLIYYDTIYVHVTNQSQLAALIEWFVKQRKYETLLKLVNDGILQFYNYRFHTHAVTHNGVISLWNIQEENLRPFEQKFLYDTSVQAVLPPGRKRKYLYQAIRGSVVDVDASDFDVAIENARSDFNVPARNALILQAFLDELYDFRRLGTPPKVEAVVVGEGTEKKIAFNLNWKELTTLAGPRLNFHEQSPFTAGAIANRLVWSAASMGCDLFLPKPMSVLVGDKLFESSVRAGKTKTTIESLEDAVEFPDIRSLVNEAKLDLDDILDIRRKASKFREWLQREGERDRDAIIAYHNEVAKETGIVKLGRSSLRLFGILGIPITEAYVTQHYPGVEPAIIATGASAGIAFLLDVASKIGQDWKPVVFGNWMREHIERLLTDTDD